MTYEELLIEADNEGIVTKEKDLISSEGRVKGKRIAINRNLDSKQKACALSEELGHYYTTVGNIINLEDTEATKQERTARLWAYDKQVGLSGLIKAYKQGCYDRHTTAEFLNVTEEFLQEALDCYREKYGKEVVVEEYKIHFEPHLYISSPYDEMITVYTRSKNHLSQEEKIRLARIILSDDDLNCQH